MTDANKTKAWKRRAGVATRIAVASAVGLGLGAAIIVLTPRVVLDEEPTIEVTDSEADIFSMTFLTPTDTQRFMTALDHKGHEAPRVYDMNGETVMFSANFRQGASMHQLMREYQQAFLDEGLNSELWLQTPQELLTIGSPAAFEKLQRMNEASLRGEVLPRVVTNDRLILSGGKVDLSPDGGSNASYADKAEHAERVLERFDTAYDRCGGDPATLAASKGKAPTGKRKSRLAKMQQAAEASSCDDAGGMCSETLHRLRSAMSDLNAMEVALDAQPDLEHCPAIREAFGFYRQANVDDFTKRIRSYRSVEAARNDKGVVGITASWSDENFDAKKVQPDRFGFPTDAAAAKRVPACPDCERGWSFQGSGSESQYAINTLVTPQSVNSVAEWYIGALTQRGWTVPESEAAVWQARRLSNAPETESRWLRFTNDAGEHLSLQLRSVDGKTRITAHNAN